MNRREHLLSLAAALAFSGAAARAEPLPPVMVVKSPTCGCCGAWTERMRSAGFEVEIRDVTDDVLVDFKRRVGLAPDVQACHTAMVADYVVEGHVPPADVKRLIAERPAALGIAVPGMPVGSPGMEYGTRRDPFDTILIGKNGERSVFASHR